MADISGLSSLQWGIGNQTTSNQGLESSGLSVPPTHPSFIKDIDNEKIQANAENEEETPVKNFAKNENENTEIIAAPFRLLGNSFWNSWFGKEKEDTFTNNDFDIETVNILQKVTNNALNDDRTNTHYTDYPLTKRGISAEALVGEYQDKEGNKYSSEYKKKLEDEVNAVYPNNVIGKAKFAYDLATDPVMKAIFSVGGFNIKKGKEGYFIEERFNFNSANQTEGTALKKIRKIISNFRGIPIHENEGPNVHINLGKIASVKKQGGRVMKNYNKNYNTQRFI